MSQLVDSADTNNITYNPGAQSPWFFTHSTNAAVFDSTLSEIHGPGGILFTFNGSQISVLGTVVPATNGSSQPTSTYTINGATVTFTPDPISGAEQDGRTFFSSPILPFAQYTLDIEVISASAECPYFFDYISFDPTDPNNPSQAPSSSSPPSSSSSSHASSSASSARSSQAMTSTSALNTSTDTSSPSHTSSPSSSSTKVGAIAGGVVGGVIVLVLAISAMLYWCRRKRANAVYHPSAGLFDPPEPHVPGLPPMNQPEMPSVPSARGDASQVLLGERAPLAWQSSTVQSSYIGGLNASIQHASQDLSSERQDPFSLSSPPEVPLLPPPPLFATSTGSAPSSALLASTVSHGGIDSVSSYSLSPSESASQVGARGAEARLLLGPRPSTSKRGVILAPPRPAPTQHFDSGMRFQSDITPSEIEPVDVPPSYTAD